MRARIVIYEPDTDATLEAWSTYMGGASTGGVTLVYASNALFEYQIMAMLYGDIEYVQYAGMFVAGYMLLHTGSVFIMIVGCLNIVMAFPIAYFIYKEVLQLQTLTMLAGVTLFVVVGIAVDDVFVFVDMFRQPPASMALADRMVHCLSTAARATLFTSITSGSAFAANAVAEIPALANFGVFTALTILANYIVLLLLVPTALAFWWRYVKPAEERLKHWMCGPCRRRKTARVSLPGLNSEFQTQETVIAGLPQPKSTADFGSQGMPAGRRAPPAYVKAPDFEDGGSAAASAAPVAVRSEKNEESNLPSLASTKPLPKSSPRLDEGSDAQPVAESVTQVVLSRIIAPGVIKARAFVLLSYFVLVVVCGWQASMLQPATEPPALVSPTSNLGLCQKLTESLVNWEPSGGAVVAPPPAPPPPPPVLCDGTASAVPAPAGTSYTSGSQALNRPIGANIVFSCNAAFISKDIQFTCTASGASGAFIADGSTNCVPRCDGTSITAADATFNSVSSTGTRTTGQDKGATLVFDCSPGFVSGAVVYTCSETIGVFTTASPPCVPVQSCDGSAVSFANAAIIGGTAVASPAQPADSTLVWRCQSPYVSKDVTFTCSGASGLFSTTGTSCVRNCDGSSISHPNAVLSGGTATQSAGQPSGSTLIFDCSAGYVFKSATYTCDGSLGTFETSETACSPVTCDGTAVTAANTETALHPASTGSRSPGQAYGSTIVLECAAGHQTATITFTCSQAGSFNTADGVCVQSGTPCDGTSVAHPNAVLTSGSGSQSPSQPVGSTLAFSCTTPNFKPGAATYTCDGASGTFITSDPACEPTTCDGSTVVFADATLTSGTTATDQAYGSTIVFSCDAGFTTKLVTFTCGTSGFSTTDTACTPSGKCDGTVVIHSNAVVSGGTAARTSTDDLGETIVFTCSAGYRSGDLTATYTCGSAGYVTTDGPCVVDPNPYNSPNKFIDVVFGLKNPWVDRSAADLTAFSPQKDKYIPIFDPAFNVDSMPGTSTYVYSVKLKVTVADEIIALCKEIMAESSIAEPGQGGACDSTSGIITWSGASGYTDCATKSAYRGIAVSFSFKSTFSANTGATNVKSTSVALEDFVAARSSSYPSLGSFTQTSFEYEKSTYELLAIEGAIWGIAISLVLTLIAVSLFKAHFRLAVITMTIIFGNVIVVLALFEMLGWTLGGIEAVSLSILVGTCVD